MGGAAAEQRRCSSAGAGRALGAPGRAGKGDQSRAAFPRVRDCHRVRNCHRVLFTPRSVPGVSPVAMEPREDLEVLVGMVAALGQLVATVTTPPRHSWLLLYPESLHTDLRRLTWTFRGALDHGAVTSLRQALATLKATPRVTWADVRATERVWRESVRALVESWYRVYCDAEEILKTLDEEATATSQAGDLPDRTTSLGTAGDSLVATAQQPSVTLPSAVAEHDAPVAVASEAREEAVVATRGVEGASRRGQRVEEARELLERFLDLWDERRDERMFPWDLYERYESTLEDTEELSPDVPKAAVAQAKQLCGAERLWEASARLTTDHLLVTLGEIDFILSSPCGGSGGPGGPRGRAVAELCQKAIEDIPRLLGEQ